jgi:glycerophosphoryl diester phosphodiesterase
MKLIGHRGAAWLALENTLESIRLARDIGVDAIEFDVRITQDQEFILSHDATTHRVSNETLTVQDHTLHELQQVVLHNGEHMSSLEMALEAASDVPVLIDVKGTEWAKPLVAKLSQHPKLSQVTVIALDHEELAVFHRLMPEVPTYAVQRFNPIDLLHAVHIAHAYNFKGVDLNFWLLTPLVYWLAERHKLDVIVYSVNHLWMARFLMMLFPEITITTDRPDRLQSLRIVQEQ